MANIFRVPTGPRIDRRPQPLHFQPPNLLETTLVGQGKFYGAPGQVPTYDFPVPRGAAPARHSDAMQSRVIYEPALIPFALRDWPVVAPNKARPGDAVQNFALYQQTVIQAPFILADWPVPTVRRAPQADQPVNLLGTTLAPAVIAPSTGFNPGTGGGKSVPAKKKRWWQIGDKVYRGTKEQIAKQLDAFLDEREGVAPFIPELPSKRAPERREPKEKTLAAVEIPPLRYDAFDWVDMYSRYVVQRDVEMAAMLEAAIRRRMEDEDDIAAILLLIH